MKPIRMWLLAGILLFVLACTEARLEDPPPELLDAVAAFYAAVEEGDDETRIELFGPDAILMPNHWTLSRGKEAVAEVIRGGAGFVFRIRDRELIDIGVSGALAYTVNRYSYTYHPEGDEPEWHKTKNVHIWKMDGEGRWRLHVDIWNSDVPLEGPAGEEST